MAVTLNSNSPAVGGKCLIINGVSIPVSIPPPVVGNKCIIINGVSIPLFDTASASVGDKCLIVGNRCILVGGSASPIPTNGLVFYAPLSAWSATAETGQGLSLQPLYAPDDYPSFVTEEGIPSALFNQRMHIMVELNKPLVTGDADRTVSAWVKCLSTDSGQRNTFFSFGHKETNQLYECSVIAGTGQLFISGGYDPNNEYASPTGNPAATWMHACFIHKNSVDYLYINGVAAGSFSCARNTAIYQVGEIANAQPSNHLFNGNIAAIRVYNRAVTAAELAALAGEFTPTIA